MTTLTSQTLTTLSPKPPPSSSSSSNKSLATLWWNTNLPLHLHTPACPPYLTYALTHPKERANLSTLDADFQRLSWPQVRSLVAANRLDQFTRVPSELRQYRQWTEKLVREYGSVMRFVLDERLGWRDSRDGGGRFGGGMYCFISPLHFDGKIVISGVVFPENAWFIPVFFFFLTIEANTSLQRRLQNPPQRLALRHRPAHRAPRRLDEIRHALGSHHRRPATLRASRIGSFREEDFRRCVRRGESDLVSELGSAEERACGGALSCYAV